MVALPGQPDHLAWADALGHAHVQLLAVDGDAQAVAAVGRFQRNRQLGAGVAVGRVALAAEARPRTSATTATLAREQALEEVAEASIGAATAEYFLEVEATGTAVVRRYVELLARAIALCAQLVVGRALFRVAQRLVGLVDRLELVFGPGLLADVRVVLACQPAVGGLDLRLARARFHPQGGVVILEFHPATSICFGRAGGAAPGSFYAPACYAAPRAAPVRPTDPAQCGCHPHAPRCGWKPLPQSLKMGPAHRVSNVLTPLSHPAH
ncbi:hypothetical protein PGKDCPLP_00138 [Stenotrophomonas maltophilia]|nr:hypothetical protein PGKDCPLP_00138 [Stenotrophomonas maltophilia]